MKEESKKAGLKLNIQKLKIMASSPITSWEIDKETMETVRDYIFLSSKITADGDCSHEIKTCLFLWWKAVTNLDSILKTEVLLTNVHLVKAMVFPVVRYRGESWTIKLDDEEGWALTNWHFWTVVLEKTLENRLNCKEIKSFNPKINKSWIFFGGTDPEAESPIFWPPGAKCQLIGKDLVSGND